MRNRARKGIPPTVNYRSPVVANVGRAQPIFRTRFMLVVPRNVQLDAACIKCGCEVGLRYEHGPLTAVQVESLGGTRFPKTIVGYWICRTHWRIELIWRWLGIAAFVLWVTLLIATALGAATRFSKEAVGFASLILIAPAIMLATPKYRGPLRCWKTRGDQAWLFGVGRMFRMRFPHYEPSS
jgi:hypothetical protein